jgi:hypothetical protein
MRAVWSFWPKPFARARAHAWGTELNHLLAWALSFETARRHHPHTSLVTDDDGARLLVDGLGLDFDSVSLGCNRLQGVDPAWWTLGKLVAISEQQEPFVHLDPDVFLWSALPTTLTAAPVFVQNPESYSAGDTYYQPELFEAALRPDAATWLPPEWSWYRTPGAVPRGECCGIVGGNHVAFLRHYARQGLRLVNEPGNLTALRALPDRRALTITLEQYLLAACIEHHRGRTGSPYRDVDVSYLFPSWAQAGDEAQAAQRGFTHLIADTKRQPDVMQRLERRVRDQYPGRYERCLALLRPRSASSKHGRNSVAPVAPGRAPSCELALP